MDAAISDESWERTQKSEAEIARRLGNAPALITLLGHYSFAETPEDLEPSTIAARILPEQRSYVALRVRGFSSAVAARQLNLNRLAAQRWETADWFDEVREEELKKWLVGAGIDQKQEALLPVFPAAISAIKDSLECEDPKIKLAAAQMVLDNIFGEAKRPVGRPANPKDDNNPTPDLTDIMTAAMQRINEARSASDGSIIGIVSSHDYASPNGLVNQPKPD